MDVPTERALAAVAAYPWIVWRVVRDLTNVLVHLEPAAVVAGLVRGFDKTKGLARLQDEPREDQPDGYENPDSHESDSEHGEHLPVVLKSVLAVRTRIR